LRHESFMIAHRRQVGNLSGGLNTRNSRQTKCDLAKTSSTAAELPSHIIGA
jgi:hypothetical protein